MRRTVHGLLIPSTRDPDEEPTMVCRVPVGDGATCGAVFFAGQELAWQVHVGRCARRHLDEIHADSPRTRNPIINVPQDPEIDEHMKEVGARMLREGRLTTKPSERAGF